jgi:hypothetical protein
MRPLSSKDYYYLALLIPLAGSVRTFFQALGMCPNSACATGSEWHARTNATLAPPLLLIHEKTCALYTGQGVGLARTMYKHRT